MKIDKPQNLEEWKSPEEILAFSPSELVDYLLKIEESGELESFMEYALENDALVAQFSYWEKWLKGKQRKVLEKTISRKKEIYPGNPDGLPLDLDKKYSEEELRLIFSNLGAIQLTFGCSKGCPFCGFDALPGVREHTPYPQLANLFQRYGKEIGKRKPFLYYASEPFDYEFQDKTYQDVHELAETYADYSPFVSSKYSEDDEWLDFLNDKSTEDIRGAKNRVSVYGKSEDIVAEIRNKYKTLQTVGENRNHAIGLGISFGKDTKAADKEMIAEGGIGCFDGTLLTPRGLYNIFQVPISAAYPQGQVLVPFKGFNEDNEIKIGDRLEKVLANHIVAEAQKIREKGGRYRIKNINPITVININGSERMFFLDEDLRIAFELELQDAGLINRISSMEKADRDKMEKATGDIKMRISDELRIKLKKNKLQLHQGIDEIRRGMEFQSSKATDSSEEEREFLHKLINTSKSFELRNINGDFYIICNRDFKRLYFRYPNTTTKIDTKLEFGKKLSREELEKLSKHKGYTSTNGKELSYTLRQVEDALGDNVIFEGIWSTDLIGL